MTYCEADVAKYIISYCSANKSPVTNLKLQKMLYFVWIDYYKLKHTELYCDDICAWQLGPVVPNVYYNYCAFAGTPIEEFSSDVPVLKEDAPLIDSIISQYLPMPASTLVNMTHQKGKPWDIIFRDGAGIRRVIPFELIKELECQSC